MFGVLTAAWSIAAAAQSPTSSIDARHPNADFESWTVFGELEDDGTHYGLVVSFFTGKLVGLRASGVYVVVSDDVRRESSSYSKMALPVIHRAHHDVRRLKEEYRGNLLERRGSDDPYRMHVAIDDIQLELTLEPRPDRIDLGELPVGEDRHERVELSLGDHIEARLTRGGRTVTLTGDGLLQHAWGDPPDKEAPATMLTGSLDDGTRIVALHGPVTGAHVLAVVTPGEAPVVTRDFEMAPDSTVLRRGSFPVGWQVRSGAPDLAVRFSFAGSGTEVDALKIAYWFGRCAIEGERLGVRLTGTGGVFIRGTPP